MITIIRTPLQLAGAINEIIFAISSNNNNVINYVVKVYNASDNTIISKHKIFCAPKTINSFIDLKSILGNYTSTQMILVDDFNTSVKGDIDYYITVAGLNANGDTIETMITSEIYTAINANFDSILGENSIDYNINEQSKGYFLTPFNNSYFQNYTIYQPVILYYYTDVPTKIKNLELFINDEIKIEKEVVASKGINRLFFTVNDIINNSNYLIDRVNKVEIRLKEGENYISQSIFLKINDVCNSNDDLNFVLSNDVGGVDVISLDKKSLSLQHLTEKTSYLSYSPASFTTANKTINVIDKYEYTISSNVLNSNQFLILQSEIISSKDVFLKINNNYLPVIITTSSMQMSRQKNINKRITISFTINTKSLMLLNSSNTENNRNVNPQLQYIINNFWSLVNNNKGIEII